MRTQQRTGMRGLKECQYNLCKTFFHCAILNRFILFILGNHSMAHTLQLVKIHSSFTTPFLLSLPFKHCFHTKKKKGKKEKNIPTNFLRFDSCGRTALKSQPDSCFPPSRVLSPCLFQLCFISCIEVFFPSFQRPH